MRKTIKINLLTVLLFLISIPTVFAQSKRIDEFVKNINAVIQSNKQVCFINESQKVALVKEIKANLYGEVTIIEVEQHKDSIKTITFGNEKLIPDCCGEKKELTFSVLKTKKMGR